jgi:WD40 repeat protein
MPGNETRTLFKGNERATSVAFSADGRRLAGMYFGTALIWDTGTGEELSRYQGIAEYRRLAWSAHNDRIAGVERHCLLDAATGERAVELDSAGDRGLKFFFCEPAFSDDGRFFARATANNDRIAIWDPATGKVLHNFDLGQPYASGLAFGPRGRILAAGTNSVNPRPGNRGSLQVWDMNTGRAIWPRKDFQLQVWGLSFSPDGKLLAVAMGHDYVSPHNIGQVQVWNTETWQIEHDLRGHSGCAWTVCFSPDGKRLASVGGVSAGVATSGELKIWDMATGQEVWTVADKATIYGVAFSPDGYRIATAARDGTFKLLNGTPLAETPKYHSLPSDQ